ncbi:hypothetical protein ANANG_G00165500 [Anguilla anguilla]|uniref:Uncharacterized protein n=1 Tax=Anguilla anguilla TaxID=7936 RepID=A0A9D3MF60_ANGAN|nr:hypothetical protein ANANG_G00165500 [Anguilla anguilla]
MRVTWSNVAPFIIIVIIIAVSSELLEEALSQGTVGEGGASEEATPTSTSEHEDDNSLGYTAQALRVKARGTLMNRDFTVLRSSVLLSHLI